MCSTFSKVSKNVVYCLYLERSIGARCATRSCHRKLRYQPTTLTLNPKPDFDQDGRKACTSGTGLIEICIRMCSTFSKVSKNVVYCLCVVRNMSANRATSGGMTQPLQTTPLFQISNLSAYTVGISAKNVVYLN